MEETRFVRLGPDDALETAALEERCFSLPWSTEQFLKAFEQRPFAAFGIRRGEVLVAYISVYHTPDELEILNIAVSPEYRKVGHAKQLLGIVLHLAEKMGILRSVLEVRPSNTAARALYEGYGYRPAGRRKGYYPDTGEDALVYVVNFPLPGAYCKSDA